MRLLETTDSLTTRSTRLAQSAQKTRKNVVYPLPKEFVEKLAEWYGAPLTVSAQIKQFIQVSRLKDLSRLSTTVIE